MAKTKKEYPFLTELKESTILLEKIIKKESSPPFNLLSNYWINVHEINRLSAIKVNNASPFKPVYSDVLTLNANDFIKNFKK